MEAHTPGTFLQHTASQFLEQYIGSNAITVIGVIGGIIGVTIVVAVVVSVIVTVRQRNEKGDAEEAGKV